MQRASPPSIVHTGSTPRGHAIHALLVVSLAVNMAQAHQLRSVARDREQPNRLAAGKPMPALQVRTASGAPASLSFSGSSESTIIYYFSPSCRWCAINWPRVIELERATRGQHRFVAVSTAAAAELSTISHRVPFDVYGGLDDRARVASGLGGTPHTVVSRDGRVLTSWMGAFRGRVEADVEAYFRMSFSERAAPGITP